MVRCSGILFTALLLAGCSSLDELYVSEVNREIAQYSREPSTIITEESIEHLPEPVKRYFRHAGYIGKESPINVRIAWRDVYFRRGRNQNWMRIDCYQFNSVPEPVRIVLMKSKIAGIFPFEGRDKYQDGHGNMFIKLLKMFTVADVRDKKMDESALVTVLAETFFVPSYALQNYMQWESIDTNTARATLSYNGTEVSGVFHFNDAGEFIRFDTDDRYQDVKDSATVRWSAYGEDYIEKNGIRFPSYVRAVWHEHKGDFEYFKGRIENLEFNVKE